MEFDVLCKEKLSKLLFLEIDKDKFINLYGAIKAENTQDIQKHVDEIKKEWKNRKISFIKNKNVSMINVFLHDPEDEIFERSYLGICRNWYCPSGGCICSGKNQLRRKTFPYGNPAFRGDQDYLCVLYGIPVKDKDRS